MNIAITSTDRILNWPGLGTHIMGAGIIQPNYIAKYLATKGYKVDVITDDEGDYNSVRYTSTPQKEYDAVIAYREPKACYYANGRFRVVNIQDANHWLPVLPELFTGIDKIVPVGVCLGNHFTKFIPSNRLCVIGNGYDDERITSDDNQRDKLSLCFSAAPIHGSGLHIAMQAIEYVPEVTLHVYGTTEIWNNQPLDDKLGITCDLAYGQYLYDLYSQSSREIIFHKALPYWKMCGEYTRHSIIIHPKTFETFGCSLLEAQAAGVVPVTSGLFGCGERVIDGVHGYHARYDNPKDFADKITFLLNNSCEWQVMSNTCISEASKYCFSNIARQWEAILESA